MGRKNTKNVVYNGETTIKKSNEISLARLNKGFTLNQVQLLSFAIFNTQKDGATTFNKASFERQFGITKYATKDAVIDSDALMDLKLSFIDLGNDRFRFSNVFTDMYYERGTFVFEWNPKFIPHILDLQDRYLVNDLTLTSKFKSAYSWILYEQLKALYGYFHKTFTKEEMYELFNVQSIKSYVRNAALFKKKVLDFAVAEINEHTEIEIHYKEIRKGRTITGFTLHWSSGKVVMTASEKFIAEIHAIIEAVSIDARKLITIRDETARMDALRVFNLIMDKAEEINEKTTQEQAQAVYDYIKIRMNELNQILIDTQTEVEKSSIFYNWLEERE